MRKRIIDTQLLPNQICMFSLCQTGFIFKFRDKYIMIDGYLSDYVDKNCSGDGIIWRRNFAPPITPDELDFIDYVFCTHAHFDHTDPITVSTLCEINKKAKFIIPSSLDLEKYGVVSERIIRLVQNGKTDIGSGITVTAVPSAHEEIHYDENGVCQEMGFVFDFDGTKLYHAGDCCPFDGLLELIIDCDILMLPSNGRDYYKRNSMNIIGNFTPREAAIFATKAKSKLLIPTHLGLYDINTVSYGEVAENIYRINPQLPFHIFAPGERYIY